MWLVPKSLRIELCTGIGMLGAQFRDDELFAPGPADERWAGIIAAAPWLAPAVEPGVRELASGQSLVVDESRADQLRATGNQCVAPQAAAALVVLARRVAE